jgi:N,N-dimethylformamidase
MYGIDPRRLDLAREFKAQPFGTHSPDLQALLTVMRQPETCGDYVIVCTTPHAEWMLARKQPDGAPPQLLESTFASLEAAEWHAFKTRWEAITGVKLEIE